MGFSVGVNLYANLGLKVEFGARLTKRKTRAVSYKPNIFSLSLVSKAESSDKNLTDIFMNQSGLKEPGQINVSKIGERFQRKLENLRNYYAFKNLRFTTVWSEVK